MPRNRTGRGRSPLAVIFLTVFIDLIGFGIILPLSPYLAREHHATPAQIGLLMAIYSGAQFLFSPLWGSLSDRVGRRPVILLSLFGAGLSYFMFAFADTLWLLFAARALAGVFGGNISAAHAYIADVTKPEERSKGMGLIGAAFGLGFIFGPIMGGLLGELGKMLGSAPPFGLSFAALGAAALCFGNFFLALAALPESLPPEKRARAGEGPGAAAGALASSAPALPALVARRFAEIGRQAARPLVGSLIAAYFLSGLAMAQMEAMLFTFMDDRFGWGMRQSSYGFAYVGVLMVLVQGYFIRKWTPKYGEPALLSAGLLFFAASLFGIAASHSILAMAIVMTFLAVGNGLMRPPNLGMISLLTPAGEQGAAMGVTNSVASLGRIIGPVFGGWLYQELGSGAPFVLSGILASLALAIVGGRYSALPASGRKRQAASS
jgi:MFS family permease